MEKVIKELKEKYESINIQIEKYIDDVWIEDEEDEDDGEWVEKEITEYHVSNISGLDDMILILETTQDFTTLSQLLESGSKKFNDFLAIHTPDDIEVLLSSIRNTLIYRKLERQGPIEIEMNYNRNKLDLKIEVKKPEQSKVGFISSKAKNIRFPRRPVIIMSINGLNRYSSDGIETDVRNITNSVLFDIECTYNIALETVIIETYKPRRISRRLRPEPLPNDPIQLLYKQYTPELIEYFHIADKVNYLPFKYVCYFHVIEYFMDKSAYNVVARKIWHLLMNPDFHLKSKDYIGQAINIFKKENEKFASDKIKIGRVLKEFIEREYMENFLKEIGLIDHFSNEAKLQCSKLLKLPAIKFDNEKNFYDSLTKRVYSMRCSIVHSNPDFDESKAIPFSPTPINMEFLRDEMELIKEIALKTIVNSIT